MGLRPPEFGMNTEKRGERNAKWILTTDTRNKGPKGTGNKSQKSKEQLQTSFGSLTACVEYVFQSEACPVGT